MAKNSSLHRILAFWKHFFTSWNTTGEGIHSPYLFELVRFVLRDRNSYYCFADIERRREMLLACEDALDVVDYGSQGSPKGKLVQRRVCDIAKNHLERAQVGQVLFRLVNWIGEHEKRPLEILELGTSLGVTTAYLAAANSRNRVMTMEGSAEVLKVAQSVWRALKLENIEWVEGNIDDTLFIHAREKLDVAYVDANHRYEPTCRYVEFLASRAQEKSMVIIDDIHYSEEMERAWKTIQGRKDVTTTMDFFDFGIVFFDSHYLKKHYRLRI